MKLTLRPLPDLGFQVVGDKVSFDERLKWLPQSDPGGNQFGVERAIKPVYLPLPDLQTAPIGVRLRFVRKRRGLTIPELGRLTGISHGSISRLETGSAPVNIAAVGKILAFFGPNLAEVFPDGQDPRDQLLPVSDFASWLRNFRMRKGLRQVELARILRVSKVTVCRYEQNRSRPQEVILKRLKKAFKLDGEFDRAVMARRRARQSDASSARRLPDLTGSAHRVEVDFHLRASCRPLKSSMSGLFAWDGSGSTPSSG